MMQQWLADPLVYLAMLLVVGIAAQWLSWKLRLPAILALLLCGLAVGSIRRPDEVIPTPVLLSLVSLSVAVVLFEGGLTLRLREIRETGGVVLRLTTVGILVTWGLSTVACGLLIPLSWPMATLVGAILIVSGPTVIMPLLWQIRPSPRIGSVAKWEGIVNDPIGAVFAVLTYETLVFSGGSSGHNGIVIVLQTLIVGGAIGVLGALVLIESLKRLWIPDSLENAVVLAVVLLAFVVAQRAVPESGLVTVTVMGMLLANQRTVPIRHVIEFKEHLRMLLISTLFVVLAGRVELSSLASLGWRGVAFLLVLLLIVRPCAVVVSTWRSGLSAAERAFLACLAPRGIVAAAVASVFALELRHDMPPGALAAGEIDRFVSLIFLVIAGTVAVYGLAAAPLARRLGLSDPNPQGLLIVGAERFIRQIAAAVREAGFPVMLVDSNYRRIADARMEGLTAWQGNILAESAHEDLDLGGIGRLLAMTPNDGVNALAAVQFAEVFGRANVYQLVPEPRDRSPGEPLAPHLRGRYLFHSEATYTALAMRFAAGQTVKTTGITETFDFEAFQERYGSAALVLFVIDGTKLHVVTADESLEPKPGQKLIAVVPPADESEASAETGSPA